MSATATEVAWTLPYRGRVGMLSLIGAEAAVFVIFVVAYLFYAGKSASGPTPAVLHAPIFFSICLLSSSFTIHRAVVELRRGELAYFARWWLATIALGAAFLFGTALEWRHLVVDEGLTVRTNLFGTTYYSLVGLHAFHVTVGLLALATVSAFEISGRLKREHADRLDVLSMYWHFVDVVWVVVFLVVYVIGR
jgi:cytochrome c oxidase subunit III